MNATAQSMMTLDEAAQACAGIVRHAGTNTPLFNNVSTDSRSILTGELFVALKGEHFDGHEYVRQTLAQGAAAAMVEQGWLQAQGAALQGMSLIVVNDTRLALGALAAHWRNKFDIPLIGVTGSNGKTTVKEMCAAILREQARRSGIDPATAVLATTGNLNNDIGLPLMLLRLRSTHRAAVIEMGMNHSGEIAYLSRLAAPTVALVNNAQRAHLEGLGSLSEVARAKGEIFCGLRENGVAVINADDSHAALWRELAGAAGTSHIVSFSLDSSIGSEISASYVAHEFGGTLHLVTPQGSGEAVLRVPGVHNARNALAAAATTLACGATIPDVVAGLAAYAGIKGRLQLRRALNGARLIDDSYNANPDSMRAAIDVLAALPGKKIFVLGDMGEVGEQTGQFHDEIGGYAKSMGIDTLLALGEHAATAVRNFDGGATHFKNVTELINALRPLLDPDTTVLVKGSRFMKMERVADAIEAIDAIETIKTIEAR
jgi:UDP-N-acetylmuramoyl-tripeptide--D-alanyl-D-alanine ligase